MKNPVPTVLTTCYTLLALSPSYEAAPLFETGAPSEFIVSEFPELPRVMKKDKRAGYVIRLPDNYNPANRHPVLLFLRGGEGIDPRGSFIEEYLTDRFGSEDYILVGFPLFQSEDGAPYRRGSILIKPESYSKISASYQVFLEHFKENFDPVVDWEHSVIGGFSNGAHTMGVLWLNEDPLLTETFDNILFLDGGQIIFGQFFPRADRPEAMDAYVEKNVLALFSNKNSADSTRWPVHRYFDEARAKGAVNWEAKVLDGVSHGNVLNRKGRDFYVPWLEENIFIEPYPRQAGVLELGEIEISGQRDRWVRVPFGQRFNDPVVVLSPPSYKGHDPVTTRVRNVAPDGFECLLDEWDYLDGTHVRETVHYLAVERGQHDLGGRRIEAGTRRGVTNAFAPLVFDGLYRGDQTVLCQVASDNGGSTVAVRMRNLTGKSCEVRVQEEEGNDGAHPAEKVNYVVIQKGSPGNEAFRVRAGIAPGVTDEVSRVVLPRGFGESPAFFAQISTSVGNNPCALRVPSAVGGEAQVFIEEEASADEETSHRPEEVRWVSFGY